MAEYMGMIGMRFGKLFISGVGEPYVNPKTGRRQARLLCKCDCGVTKSVPPGDIKRGFYKSCGCSQGRQTTIHGHSRRGAYSTEYVVWGNMIKRCTNPRVKAYKDYGARGITVCDRWLTFENFLADMGPRPKGLTLDRIDNNGPYAPDNCRWATKREQSLNTRRVKLLTKDGVTMTLTEWAKHIGISQGAMSYRVRRWGVDRALGHGDKIDGKGTV